MAPGAALRVVGFRYPTERRKVSSIALFGMREFCVNELCTVLHGDAIKATGAPVTY